MNKKKVLFLSHEASVTGAPIFLRNLIRQINQSNPDFIISILFAKKGLVADDLINDGIDVYAFDKSGIHHKSIFYKLLLRLKYYFLFTKAIYGYKPDLIYSNTIMNFGEVFIARLLGIKIILHIHEGYNFAKHFKYKLKISCYCAKEIIVGSNYANHSLKKLTGFTGNVVYNGFKLGEPKKHDFKKQREVFTLGVLGTINHNKGQLIALEALKLLIDKGLNVRLLLAGMSCDDCYMNVLNDFINSNKLNSYVEILGFVSDSEDFLKSLDLLLVPSYDEVFPTVILEAFAVGLPVVGSRVGGIPEIIDHKKNSYLFKAGSSINLAKIINGLLKNKLEYKMLVENAIDTIRVKFDIKSSTLKLNKLILSSF
jgi:glycosyltransferase involved in cell wall biosynthesis